MTGAPDGSREPLRVLSVMPGKPHGNNMIFVRDMGPAFRRDGVDVIEFYVSSRTNPLVIIRELVRLRSTVVRECPVLLHAQYGGVTAMLVAMAAGHHPMVLSIRGSDLNLLGSVGFLRNRLTRLMTRLAALRSDAVICVSTQLRSQLWGSAAKAYIIPSGVDMEVFHPTAQGDARRSLGIDEATRLVLFNAGNAPELKGLGFVERAMNLVCAGMPTAKLHILRGSTGQSEVATLMNAADCLVLASEAEGSPNVVKEAMACNLPVVATAVGDVATRLDGVSPGVIVPRTVEGLANGILDVLKTGGRSNGRQILHDQRLSRDQVVERVIGIYRQILDAAH